MMVSWLLMDLKFTQNDFISAFLLKNSPLLSAAVSRLPEAFSKRVVVNFQLRDLRKHV